MSANTNCNLPDPFKEGPTMSTYQISDIIIRVPFIDSDAFITEGNAIASEAEASAYHHLDPHPRIAHCLSDDDHFIVLEYYPSGDLASYSQLSSQRTIWNVRKWARQMIEIVAYMHEKHIIHTDLRLEKWLVDSDQNVRLSSFHRSVDERIDPEMRTDGGLYSKLTDLYQLGSSLYNLLAQDPDKEEPPMMHSPRFKKGDFPNTDDVWLGSLISKAWSGSYASAHEMLQDGLLRCNL